MNGMEMLLKQAGIDPKKLAQDFASLKDGVTSTLATISNRLDNIERQNALNTMALKFLIGNEDKWKAIITMWEQQNTQQLQAQKAQSQPAQQQT